MEIIAVFNNFAKAPEIGNMHTARRGNTHSDRCGNTCGQNCHAKEAENKLKYNILRGILNV